MRASWRTVSTPFKSVTLLPAGSLSAVFSCLFRVTRRSADGADGTETVAAILSPSEAAFLSSSMVILGSCPSAGSGARSRAEKTAASRSRAARPGRPLIRDRPRGGGGGGGGVERAGRVPWFRVPRAPRRPPACPGGGGNRPPGPARPASPGGPGFPSLVSWRHPLRPADADAPILQPHTPARHRLDRIRRTISCPAAEVVPFHRPSAPGFMRRPGSSSFFRASIRRRLAPRSSSR